MYREILTKAIIAKGEKCFTDKREEVIEKELSKVLGCWVINHKYSITKQNQKVKISGSYDVYFWYGYNQDTACDLLYKAYTFEDEIPYTFSDAMQQLEEASEIKCYVLKQPTCISMDFNQQMIHVNIERKYAIDIVGETKLTIKVNDVSIDQMIDTNYLQKKEP